VYERGVEVFLNVLIDSTHKECEVVYTRDYLLLRPRELFCEEIVVLYKNE